jgi:hypothetical protein
MQPTEPISKSTNLRFIIPIIGLSILVISLATWIIVDKLITKSNQSSIANDTAVTEDKPTIPAPESPTDTPPSAYTTPEMLIPIQPDDETTRNGIDTARDQAFLLLLNSGVECMTMSIDKVLGSTRTSYQVIRGDVVGVNDYDSHCDAVSGFFKFFYRVDANNPWVHWFSGQQLPMCDVLYSYDLKVLAIDALVSDRCFPAIGNDPPVEIKSLL